MNDLFRMDGLIEDIRSLVGDLQSAVSEVEEVSPRAARESAEIIAREQRRIFDKAFFMRDKNNYPYKYADSALIQVIPVSAGLKQARFLIGFDSPTIEKYPELLLVEFGRPGRSPRRSSKKDKRGRNKGIFPEAAQTMPIRQGTRLAREEAFNHYRDALFDRVSERFYRR